VNELGIELGTAVDGGESMARCGERQNPCRRRHAIVTKVSVSRIFSDHDPS